MKLLEGTKKDRKDKNCKEVVLQLEITEIVLVYCILLVIFLITPINTIQEYCIHSYQISRLGSNNRFHSQILFFKSI